MVRCPFLNKFCLVLILIHCNSRLPIFVGYMCVHASYHKKPKRLGSWEELLFIFPLSVVAFIVKKSPRNMHVCTHRHAMDQCHACMYIHVPVCLNENIKAPESVEVN